MSFIIMGDDVVALLVRMIGGMLLLEPVVVTGDDSPDAASQDPNSTLVRKNAPINRNAGSNRLEFCMMYYIKLLINRARCYELKVTNLCHGVFFSRHRSHDAWFASKRYFCQIPEEWFLRHHDWILQSCYQLRKNAS